MKNDKKQRLMSFSENVDVTEAKVEHRFVFKFSKKYIQGKKILNIGSWTGPFELLAVNHASDITAIDIDEKPLKVLKKNLPSVRVKQASADKLPFKNESFDVVTMWAVIEHIPVGYELATLREINRVLKKGGLLFVSTMDKNLKSNILDPAYWLVGHRHYTKVQLNNMLIDAGFKMERSLVAGSYITAFHAWGFYFFKHILRMKMPEIASVEKAFEKDFSSKGFYQIIFQAKKYA